MKQEIKDIFQNVNEWLKFAEAKHAGIIALNSGIILGILSIYKDYKTFVDWYFILATFILIGISIIISLISFFPVTQNSINKSEKVDNLNVFFFGTLSKLHESELKEELLKITPNYTFDKFDDDLINQIIVNSKITSNKYKLFKFSVLMTAIGLGLPIINVLIRLIWH
ncbi:Pycsar system effector family protein [Melioribacter sp. Ez-97]|uniref:Pycsar system effector family protein n=1 Tax=Melioribacter sp. Ez-97 TaxID=3423434 RepID=UPI003ED9EC6A